MVDEQKKFSKEVNVDKAKVKNTTSLVVIVFSLLSYVIPLAFGEFDFGVVCEGISFIFLLLSRSNIAKYNVDKAKGFNICAMIPIGLLLAYDLLWFLSYAENAVDLAYLGYEYYIGEAILLAYMGILFAINKDLAKAENPEKYKESTDWFYEKYEKDDNGGK